MSILRCTPLTPETRGCFSPFPNAFKTGWFINKSRKCREGSISCPAGNRLPLMIRHTEHNVDLRFYFLCSTFILGRCFFFWEELHSFHCSINLIFFWSKSPQWASASSFTTFRDHTQRRTTVGRTPLDE